MEEKQEKIFKSRPKIKTKDIALSAVLTAISILFPLYLPTFFILGITSVTPFSHLGIMIGCFVNPVVAIFTCIGTFCAFLIKGMPIDVLLRAASHVVFALFCSLMMYKRKGYKGSSFYAVFAMTTVLHAALEVLCSIFAIKVFGVDKPFTFYYIFVGVGLITAAHSIFDYSFAVLIYNTLSQAKLVNNRFDLRIRKPLKPAKTANTVSPPQSIGY